VTGIGVGEGRPEPEAGGLRLVRTCETVDGTFGVLHLDGRPFCLTLEPRWLDNEPMRSCIPRGSYTAMPYASAHFQREVLMLRGVPGRTAVEVHVGNTVGDTHGCILVGTMLHDFGGRLGVGMSGRMLDALLHAIKGRGPLPFQVAGPAVVP